MTEVIYASILGVSRERLLIAHPILIKNAHFPARWPTVNITENTVRNSVAGSFLLLAVQAAVQAWSKQKGGTKAYDDPSMPSHQTGKSTEWEASVRPVV